VQTRDEIFDDASGDLAIGELEKAVEKYRRCIELDPEFFDGWHALGMALMKLGQFPEAIKAAQTGLALAEAEGDSALSRTLEANIRLFEQHSPLRDTGAAGSGR